MNGDMLSNGTVTGVNFVGGLIGNHTYGNDIHNSYSRCTVIGTNSVGGLFGNCSQYVEKSYAAGAVTGTSNVGGLCGSSVWGIQDDCFWDIDATGQSVSAGGGIGKTTAEMKTKSTFTAAGWDFTTIWAISPTYNNGYPNLDGVIGPPAVTTLPATGILATQATLNGNLTDDGGEMCDCGFEWGLTPLYGNTTSTTPHNTGDNFAKTIIGLTPNTIYHFRTFATNSAGTSHGADATFTTLVAIPVVASLPATAAVNHAAMSGNLTYDGGEACDCGFEWGLTPLYGNLTPTTSQKTGDNFAQFINGLTAGTTYHFRALATNSIGTVHGADTTFVVVTIISSGGGIAHKMIAAGRI
jgi:hypothetical protein